VTDSRATWFVEELTPRGPGGVSVLRLTGPGARAGLAELGVEPPPVGVPRVVRLRRGDEDLDEALVLVRGPEELELHVHGSPPLVRSLVREAPRPERPGLEEEAELRLAAAPVELTARLLLAQVEGALRQELARWAALEDAALLTAAASLASRSAALSPALEPARVLLAGPVNAGKSTLFNALVGEQRAITSEEPGTTRDLLVEPARLGVWPVVVCDTAGLRRLEASDPALAVERAGQELALQRAGRVDWVLWLDPPESSLEPPELPGVPVTRLPSRTARPGGIQVLEEPEAAVSRVSALFHEALGLESTPRVAGPVLCHHQDRADLARAVEAGAGAVRELAQALLDR